MWDIKEIRESKIVPGLNANLSYEKDFDLHENEPTGETRFHRNGFALRLVLKQRHKRTQKWPIKYTSKW